MAYLACELQWLHFLFKDLQIQFSKPINVYCDKKSTIHLAHNSIFHKQTKYIDIDCHIIYENIQDRLISLLPILFNAQIVDVLSKQLHSPSFLSL